MYDNELILRFLILSVLTALVTTLYFRALAEIKDLYDDDYF